MTRRLVRGLVVLVLAVAMLGFAGLAGVRSSGEAQSSSGPAPVAQPNPALSTDNATAITALQQRLGRLPGDWPGWATLGARYVAQARTTADPSYYGKADAAFRQSLRRHPSNNAPALTGLATLAAARHRFTQALRLGRRSQRIDPYNAVTYGVLSDALIELGRYPEAFSVLQRMVDLKPGVASYTRVSYSYELRGDTRTARRALQRALDVAYAGSDAAYALYYLGELAWNAGDLRTAARRYEEGLRRDSGYLALLAGRAKVEAARGQTAAALRDYRSVTERLPQPSYVIEYGDLLHSLGRRGSARQQYALVRDEERLFIANGAKVDLELALFDADHGRPHAALQAARAEYARRQGIFVEDAYAWALHVNHRDREALGHARKAARLGVRSALLSYHRGAIEAALGDRQAARTSLRRALQINPHFSTLQAPKAHRLLAQLGASSPTT